MRKKDNLFALIMALVMAAALSMTSAADIVHAGEEPGKPGTVRTVMLYLCGSDLEENSGDATFNLHQILKSNFSEDDDIKLIVLTGGAEKWHLESEYISADADLIPEGETADKISTNYNQLWEARGADAGEKAGKMVLIDGDGITSDKPVKSKDEMMSDKRTLKAFIDLCVEKYPAQKYDLILWDHGGGPSSGFAIDGHGDFDDDMMPFSDIVDAVAHNKVVDKDGNGKADGKFDFIDFDACLMGSVELDLMLADYADYYIASPEIEPGYGQEYNGWLNLVGTDPNVDTFELGRKIVGDYISFYMDESTPGYGQQATLAVTDLDKLKAGLTDVLDTMSTILKDQARKGLFYDELISVNNAIRYGNEDYYDFGNLAGLLSVTASEISEDLIDGGVITDKNAYSEAKLAEKVGTLLSDEEIIYAGGTPGIVSREQIYRLSDGEIELGDLVTSGLSIYFAMDEPLSEMLKYYDEMAKVIEMLPDKEDGRYEALKKYIDAQLDYALLHGTGSTISEMLTSGKTDKSEIDYEKLKAYCKSYDDTGYQMKSWKYSIQPLIDRTSDGPMKTEAWLSGIVSQQAKDALMQKNITASRVKMEGGTGYRLYIKDASKRILRGVKRSVVAEIPALVDYVEKNYDPDTQTRIMEIVNVKLNAVNGYLTDDDLFDDLTVEEIIRRYNEKNSTWTVDPPENKLYAIKDSNGKLHAAAILSQNDSKIDVKAVYGSGKKKQQVVLSFRKDDKETNSLMQVSFGTKPGDRPVKPEELTETLTLMPVLYFNHWNVEEYLLPTSESTFDLSSGNADKISLVYKDIRDISDIKDTDGDGESMRSTFEVKDIYGEELDVTDIVNKTEEDLIDIKLARVRPAKYKGSGEKYTPELEYKGEKLEEGKDYSWDFLYIEEGDPVPDLTKTGEYRLLIKGLGRFTGYAAESFYIVYPEALAEALIEQAGEECSAAEAELGDAIKSGDKDRLDTAYARLLSAQEALKEAEKELRLSREAFSEEREADLKEEIDDLKNKVSDLQNRLDEAMIVDISNYRATIPKGTYVYTGYCIYPKLTVAGMKKSDYQAFYDENLEVGRAVIEITGLGRYYKGKIEVPFNIVPKKAKVSNLKAGVRKLTVKAGVKVRKTGGARYEIQYRAVGSKKWNKKTTGKQTLTIRNLKKGKRYQVRIRAFKKSGKKTYRGAWSKVKTSRKVK